MSDLVRDAKAWCDEREKVARRVLEVRMNHLMRDNARDTLRYLPFVRRTIERVEGCKKCRGKGVFTDAIKRKMPCPACARDRELLSQLVSPTPATKGE